MEKGFGNVMLSGKGGDQWPTYWTTHSVFFSDGTMDGDELVDKSPLALNATITTNGVTNANCESDIGYLSYNNGIITRSSTQKHGGTTSMKVVGVEAASGIRQVLPHVVAGRTYTISAWVYIEAISAGGFIFMGRKTGTGVLKGSGIYTNTVGSWQNLILSYTEENTGDLSEFNLFISGGDGTYTMYVDDVSRVCTSDVENYILLQKDVRISAHDVNNIFYDASGYPKTIYRADLPLSDNDKIFYDEIDKILIRDEQVAAREKDAILNWLGGVYTIDKYFTGERTIRATDAAKHFGFGITLWVGNRLYAFYRDGRSHTSDDGKAVYQYSDDTGITWSTAADLYTGAEILVNNPDFTTDHPGCKVDIRDLRGIVLANGNVVILADAVVCLNDTPPPDTNIDVINVYEAFAVCLMIPASGSSLTIGSMTISYLPETVRTYVGDIKEKSGVLYASTWYNGEIKLHTSSNFGITWTTVSTVFNRVYATENGLCFVGNVLYCVHRMDVGTDAYVARSYDYGATWEDETLIALNIHWPELLETTDGKILVYGRNYGSAIIDIYKLAGVAISVSNVSILATYNADCAYGNISKKNGVYYFCYHNGPLKAAPNLYGLASAAFCYKAIVGTHIEDF